MKFCKDCKHFDDGYCTRNNKVVSQHAVYGYDIYSAKSFLFCSIERKAWLPWECGKKARFFEEKNND